MFSVNKITWLTTSPSYNIHKMRHCTLGICDSDILVSSYFKGKIFQLSQFYWFNCICTEGCLQSNYRQMCLNIAKPLIISPNCYDITQLLLLTIIGIKKNYTIPIIGKESITVNRQNWLIAHTYTLLYIKQYGCYRWQVDLWY